MNSRQLLRDVTPPILQRLALRMKGHTLRFSGNPVDWAEAVRLSSGYAASNILERVVEATRAIVEGRARYERDAILFDEAEYPFAIITGLLRAAGRSGGRLSVIDFGGSLGSTYRQCRPLLDGLTLVEWDIIEQGPFVEAGRNEFTTNELRFFHSPSELLPSNGERVILLSSVLQYLEDPCAVLQELSQLAAHHLIVDRTPISRAQRHRLSVQHVPRYIYEASYPCWIFSKMEMLRQLTRDWRVVCEFPSPEAPARTDDGLDFVFQGLILERNP